MPEITVAGDEKSSFENSQSAIFDWKKWLAGQGVMAVFLAAVAYFLAFFVFVPMRDQQEKYIEAVIATNKQNTDNFQALVSSHKDAAAKLDALVELNRQSATKLDGMLETQREVLPTLKQIRDDQRRGAWNDTKTAGS